MSNGRILTQAEMDRAHLSQLEAENAALEWKHLAAEANAQISIAAQANWRTRALAAEAALAWQPIETAPKNGDRILMYWTHAGICVGYWHDGDDETGRSGWRGDDDDCAPYNQKDCTHWVPLPEVPARAALSQQGGENA